MGELNLWEQVLALLDGRMNRFIFFTWFKAVGFLSCSDGLLRVSVPNVPFRDFFLLRYAHIVDDALSHLGRGGTSVDYVVVGQPPARFSSPFA